MTTVPGEVLGLHEVLGNATVYSKICGCLGERRGGVGRALVQDWPSLKQSPHPDMALSHLRHVVRGSSRAIEPLRI